MTDVQKGGVLSMRPVAVLGQGLKSAGLAAGIAAAIVLVVGILALALNWIMLLLVLPGEGLFSFGALMLIFGVAFPIAWLIAAQPFAVGRGLRRFLQRNRTDVLSFIAAALEQEAGGNADPAPDRWLGAVDALKSHIDRYPRPVRPILRLGLRRVGIGEIETALRTGSGPAPVRIASAIADRLESEFAGSPTVWLWTVGAANLLAYILVFLIA
jgi:hypothetical protein